MISLGKENFTGNTEIKAFGTRGNVQIVNFDYLMWNTKKSSWVSKFSASKKVLFYNDACWRG